MRRRWLPYAVMAYMVLALAWWTILLNQKITSSFETEVSHLDSSVPNYEDRLTALQSDYRREQIMIIGEGLVFMIILGLGLYLINRSYRREIQVAYQKRNFLLSVTHELKSPLAGIKLAFQTLQKHKLNPNQAKEIISTALDESNRLHKLVDNLLLAVKANDRYFAAKELIHFNGITEEVVESYQIRYPAFEFQFTPSVIPPILFDREGIYSLLHNLIDNAIKYSLNQKVINITTDKNENFIELSVADLGVGVPERERKKVFEQFYRIGSEDSRSTSGTGLGLYIVDKIVKAHQGNIQILPNKPSGSIFKIQIPINSQ